MKIINLIVVIQFLILISFNVIASKKESHKDLSNKIPVETFKRKPANTYVNQCNNPSSTLRFANGPSLSQLCLYPGQKTSYVALMEEGGMRHQGRLEQGQTENWHHYSIYVPAGVNRLLIQNSGGYGDGDLYTKKTGIPSSYSYDCRPFQPNNEELCLAENLSSGTDYYYSVHLYDTNYYGSTLKVSYNPAYGNNSGRTEGFGWPGNTYPQGTMKLFNLQIQPGLEDLVISTSEGSGDADLYMLEGHYANVQTNNYSWVSATNGHDSISMSNPPTGTITIGLYAYSPLNNIHLKVRYKAYSLGSASPTVGGAPSPPSTPNTTPLYHNNWGPRINNGSNQYFHVDVPTNKNILKLYGNYYEGDMDIYVAKDRIPSIFDYDCRSINSGFKINNYDDGFGYDNIGNELCVLPNKGLNRYYVMMTTYKNRTYSQAEVMPYLTNYWPKSCSHCTDDETSNAWSITDKCSYEGSTGYYELLNGFADQVTFCARSNNLAHYYEPYWIRVPSGSFNITIKTDHGTGNGNLFADGNWPNVLGTDETTNVIDYNYSSTKSGNRECIEVSSSSFTGSFLHILFVGEQSGATLQATMNDPNGCDGT